METSEPTDAELVAETLSGRRESYGQLYDRHAHIVRAVLFALGLPSNVVEDLSQECFLRAYRKLRSLQEPEKFGPWVAGIARWVAREHRRSLSRDRHQFVGEASLDVPAADDFTANIQTVEELQLMQQHLEQLPPDERLAVSSFFLDEQSAPQAAALLNLSRSGFYALLQRAIARLVEMRERQSSGKESP